MAEPIRNKGAVHALTIDVEEHFHALAMAPFYPRESWSMLESRVVDNTLRLLDLMAEVGAHATCFVLGWVAEREPSLVRRLVAAGHELASHGYGHAPLPSMNHVAFRADVARAKAVLEDASGIEVRGYRAPSFSLGPATPWAYTVLAETGHRYSSSSHPVRAWTYFSASGPRSAARRDGIIEIPVSTLPARLLGGLPFAGGAWFRVLPEAWTRYGFLWAERSATAPVVFYLHPWEIDPGQPRPAGLDPLTRLRQYRGLHRAEARLRRLLARVRFDRLDRVHPALLGASS